MNSKIPDIEVAAAHFYALMTSLPQGLIIVDHSGTIQRANSFAETMFGYSQGELTGRNIELLVPERVRQIHAVEVREYTQNPRLRPMGMGIDLKGRRFDGSEFPVEISLNPVRVGENTSVLCLISDISVRVEIEENARRGDKMCAVGQLAAGTAAYFSQLLGTISAEANTVLATCPADGLLRKSAEVIHTLAGQGAQLTQQLLTISGDDTAKLEWIDLNRRLSEMRGPLSSLLGNEIELELRLGEDVGEILADVWHLNQLLTILILNARDAMPEGGLVRVETAAIEIGETYTNSYLPLNPGPHVKLTVADTGVGMTPEVQSHLFEPFFTTKGTGPGTGLGLAIAHGILKNWGGSVFVLSQQEHGSVFQLVLPRIRGSG